MQAIILAAGMGRRLGEYTKDNTKCMLPVNDVKLIDRLLAQLSKQALNRVVIVVGYQRQNLIDYIGDRYNGQLKVSSWRTPSTTRPTTSIRWRWPKTSCRKTIPCSLRAT